MCQRPKPHSMLLRRRLHWALLPLLLAIPSGFALSEVEARAPAVDDLKANWVPVSSIPNQASYFSDRCEVVAVDVRIHYMVQRPDSSWAGQLLDFLNRKPRDLTERRILVLEVELEGLNTRYDLKRDSLMVVSGDGSAAQELIRFEGEGGVPWIAPKYSKYLYAFRVAHDVGNVVHLQVPDHEGDCEVPPLPLHPLHIYQAGAEIDDAS